jgi:hypothetical protein
MITHKKYEFEGVVKYKEDGWVIINAPLSVVNYYRWWVEKFIGKKTTTSWHSPHITVVAGKYENREQHKNWKMFHNKKVKVVYESEIYTDSDWFFKGQYFWLRVESDIIGTIRKELGLVPQPFHRPHLTICFCGY